MYVALSDFSFADTAVCRPGLFFPLKDKPSGPMIVTEIEGKRQLVFLDPQYNFAHNFMPANEGQRSNFGILFSDYEIEVDASSIYDANHGEKLGDLLIDESGVAIVARSTDVFGDPIAIKLNARFSGAPSLGFGFKNWRIVLGSGSEKQILWDRLAGLKADS